jgi:hypothetical protein|tara:strand:- start:254 stop:835 length:582 start_codon:yes stop_codon:yes gene_type:complete
MSSEIKVDTISEKTPAAGVTIDSVLIKDGNVDGVDVSAITQGITSTDQYDITSNITSVTQPITNWARNTQTLQGNINAGVTVSSGIFTFPSTGHWLINAYATINITTGSPAYLTVGFKSSNDNFSSEDLIFNMSVKGNTNTSHTTSGGVILDITDTANDKVKLEVSAVSGTITLSGATTNNRTYLQFIRLGDT